MAHSEDVDERREAVEQLYQDFAGLPDKEQAWDDLLALIKDEDSFVRWRATYALGSAYQHVTDKEEAWKDFMALTEDEDNTVRYNTVFAFGSVFPYVTDKEQASKDLLALTKDKHYYVRGNAALSLGSAFPYVTDKEQATKKLLELTTDKSINVRMRVASALGEAFPYVTDKEQTTKKLLMLAKDNSNKVRENTAHVFGSAFFHFTDKEKATKALLELTKCEGDDVRYSATFALGSVFLHITDKERATKSLFLLTKDKNNWVRVGAAYSLGSAFPYITNKKQATKYLFLLTKDMDSEVRRGAASSLGSVFLHVTDKEQAWINLISLTNDKNNDVRSYANHSLGRISILNATEAEGKDGFREELEHALEFFEKSAKKANYSPAKFCLPFYRSFHAITFRKEESEFNINESIKEAKEAVGGSESKEKLLEVIENLSSALTEAQKAGKIGLNVKQSDLKAWKSYCDKTETILKTTQDKAPVATKILEMGMPIVGQRIDEIIGEIREKAKALLKATENTGTPYENPSAKIARCSHQLSDTDTEKSRNLIPHISKYFNELCKHLPDDKKGDACDLIKELEEEVEYEGMLFSIRQILFNIVPNIEKAVSEEKPKTFNHKILEGSVISIAIATPVSRYFYAKFDKMGHLFALEESLVIFVLIFILIFVFYSIKKNKHPE